MEQSKKQECIELIKMIYRHHAAGGCLHIVLDDDNTEDEHIDVCVRYINETVDNDDYRNAWFHCIEMACGFGGVGIQSKGFSRRKEESGIAV